MVAHRAGDRNGLNAAPFPYGKNARDTAIGVRGIQLAAASNVFEGLGWKRLKP